MKEHVLGDGILKTVLIDQGNLVTGAIVLTFAFLVLAVMSIVLKKYPHII